MDKKEWFGLGIRLVGVFQLVTAATYVMSLMDVIAKITPPSDRSQWVGEGTTLEYSFYAISYLILAFALLRGADFVTEFSYPPKHPLNDDQPESSIRELGDSNARTNQDDDS